MDKNTLRQQLTACILQALEQIQFARPDTHDRSITDAYASQAAERVVQHVMAAGWVLTKTADEWPARFADERKDLQADLRSTIRFPLLMAKKPPRSQRDLANYRPRVAEAVTAHILLSHWELAPALAKKPPAPSHTTSLPR